jgi:hypothetical protein
MLSVFTNGKPIFPNTGFLDESVPQNTNSKGDMETQQRRVQTTPSPSTNPMGSQLGSQDGIFCYIPLISSPELRIMLGVRP